MSPTTRAPVFTAPRVGANGDIAVRDRPTAPESRSLTVFPGPIAFRPSSSRPENTPRATLLTARPVDATRAPVARGATPPRTAVAATGARSVDACPITVAGRPVRGVCRGSYSFDGKWRYAFEFPSQFGRRGSVETTGKTEATITSEYTTTGQQPPPGSSRSVTPTRHASPAATGRPVPTGTRGFP
jgi:hypothetical protein